MKNSPTLAADVQLRLINQNCRLKVTLLPLLYRYIRNGDLNNINALIFFDILNIGDNAPWSLQLQLVQNFCNYMWGYLWRMRMLELSIALGIYHLVASLEAVNVPNSSIDVCFRYLPKLNARQYFRSCKLAASLHQITSGHSHVKHVFEQTHHLAAFQE